jgi:hypothetical protein
LLSPISLAFPVFDAGYHQQYSYSRIRSAVGGMREHGHSIAFNFAKEKGVSKPVAEEILSQT